MSMIPKAEAKETGLEKIRVLEVIQTMGIGGAETVMLNTACYLDKSRFEVHALVVGQGALVDRLRADGLGVDTFTFSKRYNWDLIRFIRGLIKKHKIDVVHTHLSRMNTYGFIATRFSRAANVMTVHGLTEFAGFLGRTYYSIFGPLSGKIVTVSNVLADDFRAATHVSRDKIAVIPNGIDLERFGRKIDRREVLERFALPLDAKIIMAVGNIRPIKGFDFLIESFQRIAAEEPRLAVVICGHDFAGHQKRLDEMIGRYHLTGRIYYTDFVPDIETLYGVADVYAMTSVSEGFSLTTVEAMASSKPVVSTDCVGPREIIDNGVDGIIVPERDPVLFGWTMLELIRDDRRRKDLGEAARRKVEERYSIQKSVAAFEELFASLAR